MTEQKRILLIDKDKDALFLISNALRKSGYIVETSTTASGIAESKRSLPDLFILDKDLPNLDGIAVSKLLRVRESTREIPIVMISSHQIKSKAKRAVVDAFITKPFELKYLAEIVEKYLELGHKELV